MSDVQAQDTPTTGFMANLTEEGLLKLLNDAARGATLLPPGAYRDENGAVWRDVLEPTGRVRPIRDADGKPTGRFESVSRRVKRPVYLSTDQSAEGQIAARKIAAQRGMDFYWQGPAANVAVGCPEPKSTGSIGWLRNGTKREDEVPANAGMGASTFDMVYEPMPEEDDIGVTSATMQGVPSSPEPAPAAPTPQDDGPDPFSDEAVAVAASQSRRSRGGHSNAI